MYYFNKAQPSSMRNIIFIAFIVPTFCFSQAKLKEKRIVYYTVFKDKNGIETNRIKNQVNSVTKFDSSGNQIELIEYGEGVRPNSGDNGIENLKKIRSATKYTYQNNKLVTDTTYYYHDNKIDYLHDTKMYMYDLMSNNLIIEEEHIRERSLSKNELYSINKYYLETISYFYDTKVKTFTYDMRKNIIHKSEITHYPYRSMKYDTIHTDYSYDKQNRIIKENIKHNNLSSVKEFEYNDSLHIMISYYFENGGKYPKSFEFTRFDYRGKPFSIEKISLDYSFLGQTSTEIKYSEDGLILSNERINLQKRYYSTEEGIPLYVYEYEYF